MYVCKNIDEILSQQTATGKDLQDIPLILGKLERIESGKSLDEFCDDRNRTLAAEYASNQRISKKENNFRQTTHQEQHKDGAGLEMIVAPSVKWLKNRNFWVQWLRRRADAQTRDLHQKLAASTK